MARRRWGRIAASVALAGVVGAVHPPASTAAAGSVAAAANAGATVPVAVAPTADHRGFWMATTDGAVYPAGDATPYGDARSYPLAAPVVGIATTAAGAGYWLLGSDGGVFSFGDARFHGSTGGMALAQPALQMVATPSGHGYWFVARDGGVFSFGDAGFHGSTGGVRLAQPVVGMAATPTGRGYWLVARDGGVFSFGDARFYGSTGGTRLTRPIVALARTGDARGYWMVARDGGVFAFGDARFYGSLGGRALPAPVIGMVATPTGRGYWLVLGNGQVEAFGDAAPVQGPAIRPAGFSLAGEVIGVDPGHNGGNGSDPSYIDQPIWNGRAYETCDTAGTETDAGYTEAAFNFDVATRLAALLRSYGATVVLTRSSNTGVGPCVDTRARIINDSGADAAIDIHGDGGPPGGQGVAVLEPVADGPNDAVIGASDQLASVVRAAFEAATGEPDSTYDGSGGLQPRSDLAGLNLTTVPKALIECANMRDAADAARLGDPQWRQEAAQGMADGLSRYLIGYP
ncbi:MAG TPA: N-acetylmuramoyl-L-alanine amidase [Acidimicrobiales bacterium]|nr:N-acetylmuramoyl-L-alanine amidase [Acidimicrobiales bacterium]